MEFLAITLGSFFGNLLDVWIVLPVLLGIGLRRAGRWAWLYALLLAVPVGVLVTSLKVAFGQAPASLLWAAPMFLGCYLANGVVMVSLGTLGLRDRARSEYEGEHGRAN